MSNIVFDVEINEINQIHTYLNSYIIDGNEHTLYCYKFKGCSVIIYHSHKMVIQGKNALAIYHELVDNTLIKEKILPVKNEALIDQNQFNIIGCDEVGVGDFFGGLVAACVFVDKKDIAYLKQLGVKDSKKLSDDKMKKLFPLIIKKVKYGVSYLNPYQYNRLYTKYNNSHILKTLLHNEALNSLLTRNQLTNYKIVMDQYCTSDKYEEYLQKIDSINKISIDAFCFHGESYYIAIACASIIARIYFLKQIDFLNDMTKQYAISIPLGNNQKVIDAALYLHQKDKKILNNLVKKHFITYNKIIEGENYGK